MNHAFFRIDTLVRSVRDLETDGFCTVNETNGGDVILSVSMSHEGTVVQIRFTFEKLLRGDWPVTTIPSDVKVSIVLAGRGTHPLRGRLEEVARSTLVASRASDPLLLRRVCDGVMECFADSS
jgi:hypothetical protein